LINSFIVQRKEKREQAMTEATETIDLSKLQDELDAINAQVTKQGSTVRQLKKDGAAADVIEEAVKMLQTLKISAAELAEKMQGNELEFDRKAFDDLLIRKMFVVPSFEIHGGVKGLFDLGPPACGLKVRSDEEMCAFVSRIDNRR
jgi:hypothetical protein